MNLKGRKFENSRLDMEIFVYEIDGKEWFMATEVCGILEHTNASRAVDLHVKWKKDKITKHIDFIEISEGVTECYTFKKINSDRIFISKEGVLQLISASGKLSQQQKHEWYNMFGVTNVFTSRNEIEFGNMLKEALDELGLEIIEQYNVDNKYRIDFYIPQLNIAVEYDEQQHRYQEKQDEEREDCIKSKLGCVFIRCSYKDSDIKNLMKVLKYIM